MLLMIDQPQARFTTSGGTPENPRQCWRTALLTPH